MAKIDLSLFKRPVSVGVIGDVMLDKYIIGQVERISPEAPIPVVDVIDIKYLPGGAANVMSNAKAMMANVYGFGVVGDDEEGRILKSELASRGIVHHVITDCKRPTTTKCRILVDHYQLLRYDIEKRDVIDDQITEKISEYLSEVLPKIDILVLSDYDKGVLYPKLISQVKELAKKNGIPILVDPKIRNAQFYTDVDYIKVNLHNAKIIVNNLLFNFNTDSIEEIIIALQRHLKCDNIIITRGKDGLTYLSNGNIRHMKTMAKEVFDVTGAGDVMTSALAIALANNYDIEEACRIGTLAASIKVGKVGTYSVTFEDMEKAAKHFNEEYL
jgi:D-beta-D-heptose 7-phosphate kinase/D-beta-D-heptose 1-phosphate adenosyltransferase